MAVKRTEFFSMEYTQLQLEEQICEQCTLHGWAIALSTADPIDILIMLEEEDDSESYTNPPPKK